MLSRRMMVVMVTFLAAGCANADGVEIAGPSSPATTEDRATEPRTGSETPAIGDVATDHSTTGPGAADVGTVPEPTSPTDDYTDVTLAELAPGQQTIFRGTGEGAAPLSARLGTAHTVVDIDAVEPAQVELLDEDGDVIDRYVVSVPGTRTTWVTRQPSAVATMRVDTTGPWTVALRAVDDSDHIAFLDLVGGRGAQIVALPTIAHPVGVALSAGPSDATSATCSTLELDAYADLGAAPVASWSAPLDGTAASGRLAAGTMVLAVETDGCSWTLEPVAP